MDRKVSWNAVFIGTLLATACLVWLGFLGRALRFSLAGDSGPIAGSIGAGGAAFALLVSVFSFAMGGMVAGRVAGGARESSLLHALSSFALAMVGIHFLGLDAVFTGRPGFSVSAGWAWGPVDALGGGARIPGPGSLFNTGNSWLIFASLTVGALSSAAAGLWAHRRTHLTRDIYRGDRDYVEPTRPAGVA